VNKLWLRKTNIRNDNYPQEPHKTETGTKEVITSDIHKKKSFMLLFLITKEKLPTKNKLTNNSNNKV